MRLPALLLLFVALVIAASGVTLAQAKKKAKPPAVIELMNPLEDPDRIEVGVLPGGKYRLNKEEGLEFQDLGKKLRDIISKRAADRRAVIVHAPPEIQYGFVVRALDAVSSAGAMPILPSVPKFEEMVRFALVSEMERDGSINVILPSAASRRDDVYLQHKQAIVISIPNAGEYYLGEKRLNPTGRISEQELAAHIRAGLEKQGQDFPQGVYVRCAVNAPYADVQLLMRAVNKAGLERIMLVAVKK